MKLNVFVYLVLCLLIASSCSLIKGKKKSTSSTTGWANNVVQIYWKISKSG